jgi:Protein of unknown function (DUF3616)
MGQTFMWRHAVVPQTATSRAFDHVRHSALLICLGHALFGSTAYAASPMYHGLCEASAAAFVDDTHFVVASDETNVLRIYRHGDEGLGIESDFVDFTGDDKSDIEAAARVGDRIYWISSQSLNKDGEDKKKRKLFFATDIIVTDGAAILKGVGFVSHSALVVPLVKASGVDRAQLNVEGLAARPAGGLFVGLRDTASDGSAVVVPFLNPADVVDHEKDPAFGEPIKLDLEGRGIRSLELVGDEFLVVAGPVSDDGGFALFRWSGQAEDAAAGFRPEALLRVPGTDTIQILSDDGSADCSDEISPVEKRAFRSMEFTLPN